MLLALAVTLSQVWVCRVDGEFTDFSMSGDSLAFGTYNSLGEISLADGKKRWAVALKEGQLGVKVASDGATMAASIGSGPISLFDAATGKPKGTIPHKGYASPILLGGGRLYAETEPNKIAAIDPATRKAYWTVEIEPGLKTGDALLAVRPVVMGTNLVLGARSGSVVCLDGSNGQQLWEANLSDSPVQAVLFDDERVYAVSARGVLYGIGRSTGTVVWHYDAQNAIAGSPLLHDGRLVMVSNGGFVVWVAALTGSEILRHTFTREEDFSVTGPVADGTSGILFLRRSGIFALNEFGNEKWSATFSSAASFRTPENYKGDFILFDSHAVFRARPE